MEVKILGSKGEKVSSLNIDIKSNYFLGSVDPISQKPHIVYRLRDEEPFVPGKHAQKRHRSERMLSGASRVESRSRISFKESKPIFEYLEYKQKDVAEILDVNTSTLSRWEKSREDEYLGKLQSKAINKIDEIIAKGIGIFGTEDNFKAWLFTPNYSLGDIKPKELLKDPYGVEYVENALEAMSWGNYV